MPQLRSSTLKRKFYKHTIEVKDKGTTLYRHVFLVNPQDMSVNEIARINPVQTLGGAYVSNFGQGLHEVTLSGLTGFNARRNADGILTDGYEEIKNIRKKIYRDFLTKSSSQLEMFWYNWEDEEYYKVIPTNFRLMRSRSEPLLYRYELPLTCLEPIGIGTTKKPSYAPLQVNMVGIASSIAIGISAMGETMTNFR